MHTASEAQVLIRGPTNVEAVRVGENGRITVGRNMVDDNLLASLDALAAQFALNGTAWAHTVAFYQRQGFLPVGPQLKLVL